MGKMLENRITGLDQSTIRAQALNIQLETRAEELSAQLKLAGKYTSCTQISLNTLPVETCRLCALSSCKHLAHASLKAKQRFVGCFLKIKSFACTHERLHLR